jgi:hypothetical protein
MSRESEKFPIDEYAHEIGWNDIIEVELHIDLANKQEIIHTIEGRRKKFRRILYEILCGRYNSDLYEMRYGYEIQEREQ